VAALSETAKPIDGPDPFGDDKSITKQYDQGSQNPYVPAIPAIVSAIGAFVRNTKNDLGKFVA
jgi:hypothetical protein